MVGINQAVWEPLTNTLYFESDQQLRSASTYLLVATRDLRDTRGRQLGKFRDDNDEDEHEHDLKGHDDRRGGELHQGVDDVAHRSRAEVVVDPVRLS